MIGTGKYDDVATEVRKKTKARAVIVVVFEGEHGNGFSVQAPRPLMAELPELLRSMANDIEQDAQIEIG